MSTQTYRKPASAKTAKEKKASSGAPSCTHGNKEYTDLNHSERSNQSFACGECGTRFVLTVEESRKPVIVVPAHKVPEDLHAFRKTLERQEAKSAKR